VEVDLAEGAHEDDSRRALVCSDRVAKRPQRFDGRIDRIAWDPKIDVAVLARLTAQQGIDAPAARHADVHPSGAQGIEHAKDLDRIHGARLRHAHRCEHGTFDRIVLGP
jgi:hypothetical protein